ncbi:MAG: hypothetical protein HYZ51_04350 [Candidatus Doudnabacteria bacterium]|nr:hypothetical protein [Candidatus Doudnabacteria bacterium]
MNEKSDRENFLKFDERLKRAKKHPEYTKILEYTLRKNNIPLKEGIDILTPGFDEELETLKNFLLWEQGQLKDYGSTES